MRSKSPLLTCVLLALAAIPASASIIIEGVISTGSHSLTMDTTIIQTDSVLLYESHGWGGDSMVVDTFKFSNVPEWPVSIKLFGQVDRNPYSATIREPVPDSVYELPGLNPTVPTVKFAVGTGLEQQLESRRSTAELSVTPSLVTDRALLSGQFPGPGRASVEVLSAAGNLVWSSASPAGRFVITWPGMDDRHRLVPEGVYFCRLRAGGHTLTRKMLLVR